MAIGDSYALPAELKARVTITDSIDDTAITNALAAASRAVDKFCRRQFNKDAVASPRIYKAEHARLCFVDDFYTTTGLIVKTDDADNGVYSTIWTSNDYELYPLNGVVDGEPGWPFTKLRAVESLFFWTSRRWGYGSANWGAYQLRAATVQVTAAWGWNLVPAPVKEATLTAAEETYKLKDMPFAPAVRVAGNKHLEAMLLPYRRTPVLLRG